MTFANAICSRAQRNTGEYWIHDVQLLAGYHALHFIKILSNSTTAVFLEPMNDVLTGMLINWHEEIVYNQLQTTAHRGFSNSGSGYDRFWWNGQKVKRIPHRICRSIFYDPFLYLCNLIIISMYILLSAELSEWLLTFII